MIDAAVSERGAVSRRGRCGARGLSLRRDTSTGSRRAAHAAGVTTALTEPPSYLFSETGKLITRSGILFAFR